MKSFVALYRGLTVSEARLVSASGDAALVGYVAARMLERPPEQDNALAPIDAGRRDALRFVLDEAESERRSNGLLEPQAISVSTPIAHELARRLAAEPSGLSCDDLARQVSRRRSHVLSVLRADPRFRRVGHGRGSRWVAQRASEPGGTDSDGKLGEGADSESTGPERGV
jgi:hypothetical protein